jgi:hypothetical protein
MIKKSNAFLGALLFAIAPYFGEISQFGRPDHHIFILTLEIAYLYSILNIAKNNFERRDDYIKSGVIAALCIWAAIETLSLVLLAEMVIFFFSYKDAEKLGLLLKKSLITLNSIGITVLLSPPIAFANILAFSILLVVSIITFHRPVHWHSVFYAMLIYYFSMDGSNAYDKISVMHIVLYLYAALYFMANIFCVGFGRTLFFAIATGLSFGGIFLYRYPKFLLGVEGGASDLLRNAWFPNIQDLTSPFGCNFLNSLCFLAYGIIIFVAIYDKAINLLSKKHENMDVFSWLLIIVNVVYFVFTCMAKRMILVSATVSLPLIIEMGTNRVFVKLLSRKVAVLNICLLVLAPPVVQRYGRLITELLFNRSSLKEGIRKKQHELYSKDEIYKFLDEMLGDTPTVIMASVYAGPRLLYCTKHNVVAVPFHSQERGIILALIVTSFQSDIADVRVALKSTNSSYIFLEKSKLSSLFHEPWAEFIELPSEVYALIKIDKGKL